MIRGGRTEMGIFSRLSESRGHSVIGFLLNLSWEVRLERLML